MPTLTLTRGIPASGKTTWAKIVRANCPDTVVRANRDDLRAMLFHKPDYSGRQEVTVTKIQRAAAEILLAADYDVIIDDTNLRPKYVREWWAFALKRGAAFGIKEFPIDLEEAIERDSTRPQPVGQRVIRRMWERSTRKGGILPVTAPQVDGSEKPEPYVPLDWAPKAIIVDIDGTVALNTSGRSPYDMTRVSEDEPNEAVIRAVRAMTKIGYEVIFCSGRNECARADTEAWLKEHVTDWWDKLLMRADGDSRKDSVVKLELFNNHIRYNFNVGAVFDDRDQVVEMWRSLGLTCLQVAPGDF